MVKFKSIHHIAIIGSNYEKSKDFYVNKLGFKIIGESYRKDKKSYKLDLKLGDIQIELFSFEDSPSRVSFPEACGLRHLAFNIIDIEEAVQELKKMNIKVEDIRIDEYTNKKFTFFFDPDGLPIELYEK